MSSSSSKPLTPRERKLKRDRANSSSSKPSSKNKKPVRKSAKASSKKSIARKFENESSDSKRTTRNKSGSKRATQPKSNSSSATRNSKDRRRSDLNTSKPKRSDRDTSDRRRLDSRDTDSQRPSGKPSTDRSSNRKKSEAERTDGKRTDRNRPAPKKSNSRQSEITSSYPKRPETKKPRASASKAKPDLAITESWQSLGVDPKLIRLLERDGIDAPFAIQQATLPDALGGRDVLGRAQTGSGKTLAFGLAMLTQLAQRKAKPKQPLALILVPTRELAMQVTDTLTPFAHGVNLDVRLIAGGMPYAKQIDALRRGVPILVATPGRLTDLVNQGHADLSRVELVVLDEADQMCDMGFMPQIVEILDLTPPRGQRLLFSATLDGDVDRIVSRYLKNPVLHEVSVTGASVTTMEHHLFIVERSVRDELISHIAARSGKTIFFVRTQAAVDRVAHDLAQAGIAVGALHGGKSQNLRTRTINDFRNDVTNVLVATDVAARGIHVDGISLVVHVDPPTDPKDYLHRSGRTARAGETGRVVTLIGPRSQRSVLAMLNRVDVEPQIIRASLKMQKVQEITGAREPSGIPWKLPKANSKPGNKSRRNYGDRKKTPSSPTGRRKPRNH